jgi:hypothetical protein
MPKEKRAHALNNERKPWKLYAVSMTLFFCRRYSCFVKEKILWLTSIEMVICLR